MHRHFHDIGTAPAQWKVKALGDLDGNGTTDIVWMDTSNNVGTWFLKDVGGTPTFIGSTSAWFSCAAVVDRPDRRYEWGRFG